MRYFRFWINSMSRNGRHTRTLWKHLQNKTIYLACSGGIDSMVLLDILHRLKMDVHVIHVNYQLRGEDSDLDAQFVQQTCERLGIPFEIRLVNLKEQLENGGSLQEEARNYRYSWFREILSEDTNNRVALAHHRDDQVETFLMNLARKSGVLGLSCMKHELKGIVRPMLDFSKDEIAKYAKENDVQWREDVSNARNSYTRNRVRNEFVPFLNKKLPNFSEATSTLIEHFQQKQNELEETVTPIVQSIKRKRSLAISTFEELDEFERIELLRQLNIPSTYSERLNQLTVRGKQLIFHDADFNSVVRDEDQFTFLEEEALRFQLIVQEVSEIPATFDKEHIYLDASKVEGELRLRTWNIGDRISPVGMTGSQLVSDIIKDAKITANAKQNQLVLHDDTTIHWCVGLKIGREAIATNNSEKILRCSINVSTKEESVSQ